LEGAIAATDRRFADDTPLRERDFPSGYIFSFLESFVADLTLTEEQFSTSGPAANRAVEALQQAVSATRWEVASCRFVSHLTTADGQPVDLSGLRVVPLTAPAHGQVREAAATIRSTIWGADTAYGRESPRVYAPPESIVIARGDDPKPFDVVNDLSARIERLLLLLRLTYAGTCTSVYEVQGETQPVRRFTPTLVQFRGHGANVLSSANMIRRTVRLSADDASRLDGLQQLLVSAEDERPGMVMTSFAVAVQNLQMSYHAHAWYEQVVDLATALEAALSGKDNFDVVLRLRTRAAALLATERDPAAAIFRDVTQLYALRSSLVHGGEVKEKDLLRTVRSITTVPDEAPIGTALGHLVDRLRDLVRRSLLARICLATAGEEPRWRLGDDAGVDAALADDATRAEWRSAWRGQLEAIDAIAAADRPRDAVDLISQDDR
jgi:hypothetical protein